MTYKTDVQTGQSGNLQNRIEGQRVTGDVRWAEAAWIVPSGLSASGTDKIEIVTLPVGAIVLPEFSRIISSGIGGTIAVTKIGDDGDDDRYHTTNSVAVDSAGDTALTPNILASVAPRYSVTEATAVVSATVTRSSAPTGGRLQFLIAFRLP